MRILQVVHGFPPHEWAGTELVTLHLSQALRARGHQVTVFTRTAAPGAAEFSVREERLDGLEVVRVVNNYMHTSSFRLLYDNPFFDEAFVRLLDRVQPEVIHFQHLQHLSVSLITLAAALGHPTVLSLHDFFFPCHLINLVDTRGRLCSGPEEGERCVSCLQDYAPPEEVRRRFSLMGQILQLPDLILTPSTFLAQKILSYFPLLREKVRPVTLGVKLVPDIARERAPGAPLRILYVGVLLPHKGAHVLIEALKGLPSDTLEVSVYGAVVSSEQSYADRLREAAQGLPVHFYEPYPHDQIGSILSRHDVLVMPMIWEETFSLLTREALMAGLPVIAARRGALPEVVQDGMNGLLFEPENAADLRRCLARLIAEPRLVEQLRDVDPQVKTVEEYAREIEGVYAEVCAGPYRVHSLQQRLAAQYRAYAALQQESERLRAALHELSTQYTAVQHHRDCLRAEKAAAEEERSRALATARELDGILNLREAQLCERNARLEAIYASTTWKLYRGYAALTHALFHRPLGKLKQWLVR
ncbi:MAG: glycosyltransferase family 4 protein [Deltaproteobacteria bacterium]|nr:glycosyltransferase family 4 protein [Deltaproteobacteria bacterium]